MRTEHLHILHMSQLLSISILFEHHLDFLPIRFNPVFEDKPIIGTLIHFIIINKLQSTINPFSTLYSVWVNNLFIIV